MVGRRRADTTRRPDDPRTEERRSGARRSDGRGTDERGAAAVEFAIVLPVFVALIFAVVSYGWMLSYRQGVSQAAAEGARAMAVSVAPAGSSTPKDRAREAINRSLSSYGVSCTSGGALVHGGTTVGTCAITTAACSSSTSTQCAKVALSHSYRAHPLIPSFPGLGIVLPANVGYTTTSEVSS